jgi:hypothetical protein
MGRIRWRLPIKPKLVSKTLLKGRRVCITGTHQYVFLPYSIGPSFTLGHITFTVGLRSATPDRPIPDSWLRRLT